jgi:hypothetical protein
VHMLPAVSGPQNAACAASNTRAARMAPRPPESRYVQ